ncbi:MAG: dnaN [Rickettsiaceae bacterium]|jgi:DNA polymerase-3 subunit beta|nr:dnaN [Rickettsiaceae bacterium]
MQFQISKSSILKALSNVNGAVEKRNTIPVLLNVKIEAKNGRLNLTATDMDIVMVSSAEALITKEGGTTVPAQLFYDIIRKIPDMADISIALYEDEGVVKINYGRSKFSLPCLDPSEFPVLSEGEMSVNFNIKSSELIKIIDKTRFAIPSDETRFYLNGMFLHSVVAGNGVELRGIATDGHRLALASSTHSSLTSEIAGVIIPKKTINEIRKIIEGNEDVAIAFSKAKIRVTSSNSVIISKLIDGEFPEYDRVIPKNNDKIVKVDRKIIFDAVDRVSTIATDKNKSVKLILENNKISLQIKSNDNGNASEEIEVDYQGETIETGFNSRYFLEILGQVAKEKISINFKDGASPALINAGDNDGLYVIMPIRV